MDTEIKKSIKKLNYLSFIPIIGLFIVIFMGAVKINGLKRGKGYTFLFIILSLVCFDILSSVLGGIIIWGILVLHNLWNGNGGFIILGLTILSIYIVYVVIALLSVLIFKIMFKKLYPKDNFSNIEENDL